MSGEERERVMAEMASYDGLAFEPSVGIFWYAPERQELFDVRSLPVSALPGRMTTINVLHKNIWTKNYFRAKARGLTDSIYYSDYTQIPRGRVFYSPSTNTFSVKVGHWIEDCKDILTPLLQEEFNLADFDYDIDIHWDLGHGWSEHNFNIDVKD